MVFVLLGHGFNEQTLIFYHAKNCPNLNHDCTIKTITQCYVFIEQLNVQLAKWTIHNCNKWC